MYIVSYHERSTRTRRDSRKFKKRLCEELPQCAVSTPRMHNRRKTNGSSRNKNDRLVPRMRLNEKAERVSSADEARDVPSFYES